MPDKPFFVYFAPGACHAPHHVPKEWADKYKGKFDRGWDKLREEIFARQKELGVVPQNAELTNRPKEIQAWDEVDPKMKRVLAREMEVYAGFMEHTDYHVGRLIDTLKDLQMLDDTMIYVIIGDNGASAEGTPNGTFNELLTINGISGVETPEFLMARIDKFGSPEAYNHYAVGWAHAMDTPYQWTKQVASHWGGIHEKRLVGHQSFLLSHPGDSLVGHVLRKVITFLRGLGLFHGCGALVDRGVPLVGLATNKSVEILEASSACRPLVERTQRAGLPDRDFVALSELRGRVAVQLQGHRQRSFVLGQYGAVAGRGRGQLGNATHLYRMMVATRK
jgi:hypothetical protein